MEPVKIESKRKLSRADAAAFFEKLAGQLKGIELKHQGVKLEFGVPAEVELKIELEFGDGKTELHW